MKEENFNKIDMLSTRVQTMEAEKAFMEEQVKASKRQNKLLVMALGKQESQQNNLEEDLNEVHKQNLDIRKQQVVMPPPELNPFLQNSQILGGTAQLILGTDGTMVDDSLDKKLYTQHDTSLMQASTDFPSELITSRIIQA